MSLSSGVMVVLFAGGCDGNTPPEGRETAESAPQPSADGSADAQQPALSTVTIEPESMRCAIEELEAELGLQRHAFHVRFPKAVKAIVWFDFFRDGIEVPEDCYSYEFSRSSGFDGTIDYSLFSPSALNPDQPTDKVRVRLRLGAGTYAVLAGED